MFAWTWEQVYKQWVCNRPPTTSAKEEAATIKILGKLFHRTEEAKLPQTFILHSLFPCLLFYLLPLYPSPVPQWYPNKNIKVFPFPILPKALPVPPAPSVSTISFFVSPVPSHCNVPSPLPCLLATYSDPWFGPGTSSAVAYPELHVSCMSGWLPPRRMNRLFP